MEPIRDQISEYNSEAILFDDLDDAIIGVRQQYGGQTVAVYDSQKCIEIFAHNFAEEEKKDHQRESLSQDSASLPLAYWLV